MTFMFSVDFYRKDVHELDVTVYDRFSQLFDRNCDTTKRRPETIGIGQTGLTPRFRPELARKPISRVGRRE